MNSNIRKAHRIYIIDNIADISDDQITEVYNKIHIIVGDKNDDDVNRKQMSSYIEKNVRYLDDSNLSIIKDMISLFLTYESEDDKKVRIALEITNKILNAIGMKKIDSLTEFVDIRRDLLLSDDTKKIINDNKEYIYANGFNKHDVAVQHNTKYKHFTIFKGMLEQAQYKLISKNKSKTINGTRDMFTVYSIRKNTIES